MRRTVASMLLTLGISAALLGVASAAITTYSGLDAGVGPGGARPNSDASAAAFDAAASAFGSLLIEDFETAPLGSFAALPLEHLTVSPSNNNAAIVTGGDGSLGYNTTSGGGRYLKFEPPFGQGVSEVAFSFAEPVQAWGAYFTGVGTVPDATVTIQFDDGSAQAFGVPGASNGGVSFFGFTDPQKQIAVVTVREVLTSDFNRDIFGIDDVRFVAADSVPPVASCIESTNPSGKNLPRSGVNAGNSGQNTDGFYVLTASDNIGVQSIVIADSASPFVSLPFASGDQVKLTQAPGKTPTDHRPGPGVIVSHVTLKGDAILTVTDTSGNVTTVDCLVSPPPK